jgi:hypothetical protein
MTQPEERVCFEMMPDGSSKKVVYLHDNLSVIMEDGIIDLHGAKGQEDYDNIMQGIEKSLDFVLGDDTTTKNHCKRVLEDPEDVIVLYEVQMESTNQELRHFICLHGYELGVKSLYSTN